MSIALVHETQTEIRRLLIAGSGLAAGDFRLVKIASKLKQAGEKAPIFNRVAQAIENVVGAGQEDVSENLLELANIVNAILYTQGETGITGDLANVDALEVSYPTTATYRNIYPVIEALTTKGPGRCEIIYNAMGTDILSDLRLINPLICALGDRYNEVSELAQKILESYGPGIAPVLKRKLDLGGGKTTARILELLAIFLRASAKELYLEALEKGSLQVKIIAIHALKDIAECDSILVKLTGDNRKEIREAAINALADFSTDRAAARLFEIFTGKERETALSAVRRNPAKLMVSLLLDEAEKALQTILQSESQGALAPAKDDPVQKTADYLFDILDCLAGKRESEVVAFISRKCLYHTPFLAKVNATKLYQHNYRYDLTLARAAGYALLAAGTEECLECLINQEGKNNNHLLALSFDAALTSRSPQFVFERYSKYVSPKDSLSQDILQVIRRYHRALEVDEKYPQLSLHNGWINVLAACGEPDPVWVLFSEGDAIGIAYLHKCLMKTSLHKWIISKIIHGLIQAKDPDLCEVVENKLRSLIITFGENSAGTTSIRYIDSAVRYIESVVQLIKIIGPQVAPILEKLSSSCNKDLQLILETAANELKTEKRT